MREHYRDRDIDLAEESTKTKKAREKIKKHLEQIEQKTTRQALDRKIAEIHRWIAKYAQARVVLKTKNISLFDENKNAASESARMKKMACRIQTQIHHISQKGSHEHNA